MANVIRTRKSVRHVRNASDDDFVQKVSVKSSQVVDLDPGHVMERNDLQCGKKHCRR